MSMFFDHWLDDDWSGAKISTEFETRIEKVHSEYESYLRNIKIFYNSDRRRVLMHVIRHPLIYSSGFISWATEEVKGTEE